MKDVVVEVYLSNTEELKTCIDRACPVGRSREWRDYGLQCRNTGVVDDAVVARSVGARGRGADSTVHRDVGGISPHYVKMIRTISQEELQKEVEWKYSHCFDSFHFSHFVEVMREGNVLYLGWLKVKGLVGLVVVTRVVSKVGV